MNRYQIKSCGVSALIYSITFKINQLSRNLVDSYEIIIWYNKSRNIPRLFFCNKFSNFSLIYLLNLDFCSRFMYDTNSPTKKSRQDISVWKIWIHWMKNIKLRSERLFIKERKIIQRLVVEIKISSNLLKIISAFLYTFFQLVGLDICLFIFSPTSDNFNIIFFLFTKLLKTF